MTGIVAWMRRRRVSAGVALALCLLGWYVLTMSGHTYSSDEETMLAAGESLASTGWFNISRDETFLMNRSRGRDGLSYSRYGPGQSLLVAPFVMLGRALALTAPKYTVLFVRITALLLPALVTAATATLLYGWARQIGYRLRIALALGLIYGVTSLAWPYSRTFFAEPLATFFLALSAYGLCRTERRWWAIAGAAAACALAVKIQSGLALPFIAIYALLCSFRSGIREWWKPLLGRVIFGALGAVLPLALLLLYNTRAFGSPLNSGYGGTSAERFFTGEWQRGLEGLTISTGKGLLFFSPTILLGLAGLVTQLRRQWRESLLAVMILVSHLWFYSQIEYWHGDGSWGPRYMIFVLPFVYLPAAGLLATLAAPTLRRGVRLAARGLVGLLIALSIFVQIMPVLLNFNVYLQMSRPSDRYFQPAASPIVWHAKIWAERAAAWWSRSAGGPPGTATLLNDFSYSEGDRSQGELLPRWSYGDGTIRLDPATPGAVDGRIVVGDHRPWPLPRAEFELWLDGAPLSDVQRTQLEVDGVRWELRFHIPEARRGTLLTLHTTTWNPSRDTQDNPRNENLGLLIETIELTQNGEPLTLRQALPLSPPELSRRGLWLWTQDSPNNHLFDVWLWYLAVSGMPSAGVVTLLLLIGLPALLAFLLGSWRLVTIFRRPEAAYPPTD